MSALPSDALVSDWEPLPVPACALGESPVWHPEEQALYWCDIVGRALHRWQPQPALHHHWRLPSEPGCCAPLAGGGMLLAMRDGLWRFDTERAQRHRLAPPPYDPSCERFNDGKVDPMGRLWVGTVYEPRHPAQAALYRWSGGVLQRMAGDVVTSNGLAWSPDARTLYWSDTRAHRIQALAFDAPSGEISDARVLARFDPPRDGTPDSAYGGRPDGAAVDTAGVYWVAMYEGQQLLRLTPEGQVLERVQVPVRCPTMPCFGDADRRTLYLTTARHGRSAAELAAQPWAGQVLRCRVRTPGVAVPLARD